MNYFCATIYGLIQGLTEFLPVSSSGHLALLPKFLEIKDPGVAFDLAMHLGTAMAIMLYFKKDVLRLFNETFSILLRKGPAKSFPFTLNYIIATGFTFVTAISLKGFAESYGRDPKLIAFNLFLFGLIMVVVDWKSKQLHEGIMHSTSQFKRSMWIGLLQSLALFPGVSRSGITITTARFLQLSRQEASRFSFLLSLPLIIGGAILKVPELMSSGATTPLSVSLYGILVSFFVGLLTIHFFLKLIKKIGLLWFGVYRFVLALLVIL